MTQLSDEVVERVARAIYRSGQGTTSEQLSLTEWARKQAIAALEASGHAELVEALEHIVSGSLSLPRFAEEQARAALARAKGEAPPNVEMDKGE